MTTPPSEDPRRDKDPYHEVRQYAWEWFQYHASQRLMVFRFFLVLAAFLSTGYVTAVVRDLYEISIGLAILLALTGFFFWRLDCRNMRLVKIAERYLALEEDRLAKLIGHDEIRLVQEADRKELDELEKLHHFSLRSKAVER